MEISSDEPVDYKQQAADIKVDVQKLTESCEAFFSGSVTFDKEEFLKTTEHLDFLYEDLHDIIADEQNIDEKIIKQNYRSLAIVGFLAMRLELYGGENLENDDSDDLEFVRFSIDEGLDLIEIARRSKDYDLLKEIIFEIIDILNDIVEDEEDKEEAIGEIYALLDDEAQELEKIVVNADLKISLGKLLNDIQSKYKDILPDRGIRR